MNYYRLTAFSSKAEKLLKTWKELGWDATIIAVRTATFVVTLDRLREDAGDPTTADGIVYVCE